MHNRDKEGFTKCYMQLVLKEESSQVCVCVVCVCVSVYLYVRGGCMYAGGVCVSVERGVLFVVFYSLCLFLSFLPLSLIEHLISPRPHPCPSYYPILVPLPISPSHPSSLPPCTLSLISLPSEPCPPRGSLPEDLEP